MQFESVCAECCFFDHEDCTCHWEEDQCIDNPSIPHVQPEDGGCEHWAVDYDLLAERADAHNCREHDNGSGYCSWCGAIIPGTSADYYEHGYDPPEYI